MITQNMAEDYMTSYYPFRGSNEIHEIESFGEFLHKTQGKDPASLHFNGLGGNDCVLTS